VSETKQCSQQEIVADLADGLARGSTVLAGVWDSKTGILLTGPGMSDEERSVRSRASLNLEEMHRTCDRLVECGHMTRDEAAAHFRRRAQAARDALAEVMRLDAAREAWGLTTSLRPGECSGCGAGRPCRCGSAEGRASLEEQLAAIDSETAAVHVPAGILAPSPCVMDMRVQVGAGRMTPEQAASRCAHFGELVPATAFERFVPKKDAAKGDADLSR
jgi:hypothetical protein